MTTIENTSNLPQTMPKTSGRHQQRFSAYAFYQKDSAARKKVKDSLGPDPSFGAISKAMSSNWKSMPQEEKKIYEDLADKAKSDQTNQVEVSSPAPAPEIKSTKKKAKSQRKRARTAFTLFSMDEKIREEVKKEHPDADFGAVSQIMGAKWKELSESDKAPYHEASAKEKAVFASQKPTVEKQTSSTLTTEVSKTRKRARSAYTFYSSDSKIRSGVKEKHPDSANDFGAISKLISAQWKNLTEEEKKPYVEASNQEKLSMTPKETVKTKPTKRARSAYSLYTMDSKVKESLKTSHPDVGFTNFSKLVAAQWKTLSDAEKQPYIEASNQEKESMVSNEPTTKVTSETKKSKQKRAKSAYTLYSSDTSVREKVKSENPDADFGAISKLIAAQWKALTPSEKKPYEEQSTKEKKEVAAYKEATKPKKTRAKSAYLHYSMNPTIRGDAKKSHPTMSVTELAKILGAQWKALSDEERKPYNDAYLAEKATLESTST